MASRATGLCTVAFLLPKGALWRKWNERRYEDGVPEELDLFKVIVRLEEVLNQFDDAMRGYVRDM